MRENLKVKKLKKEKVEYFVEISCLPVLDVSITA
jgi:hypothetical protein